MQATVWVLGVLNNASTLYDLTTVSCHLCGFCALNMSVHMLSCYITTTIVLIVNIECLVLTH